MRKEAEIIEIPATLTPPAPAVLLSSAAKRTALLCIAATLIGAIGWSGSLRLNFIALLFPFLYLGARRRADTFCAAFYYAASTWSVVPGSSAFFKTGHNPVLPTLIWLFLIGLSALPWVAFYNRRFVPLSCIAALLVLAIPPFGFITVTHPLLSAGQWFPATRWLGLLLPLILLLLSSRLGFVATTAVLLASSVATHLIYQRPIYTGLVVPINTTFGSSAIDNPFAKMSAQSQDEALQQTALAHPNAIVLFPESTSATWNPLSESRWSQTFVLLSRQHTAVLIGTTLPIPRTAANQNVLLSRGYSEHLSYIQRVPVPLGMWHFGEPNSGFPLMLRYPSGIRIWDRRAAVLICYEQLVIWPALQSLSANPQLILAPSNLYWATTTKIPAIQHVSAQDWADLWAIPLYEATNR